MIKTRQYLLLSAFLLLSVSLFSMSSQISCAGLKCLQFSHQGRMVIVFGVLLLTCIHKYLGLIGIVLFMYHIQLDGNNDLVVDEYNCKVIDNKIAMDSVLKTRSMEKKQKKILKENSKTTPFRGNFSSCPSNFLKGTEYSVLPLSLKSLANARFI